jgi:hypothetical protein
MKDPHWALLSGQDIPAKDRSGDVYLHRFRCCSGCEGTGYSGEPEANGLCWDCRGTGCAHPDPCQPAPSESSEHGKVNTHPKEER